MSARIFPEDILFFQRLLKAEGLYGGGLDGIWGPITEKAACAFEEQATQLKNKYGEFDYRSEQHIMSLSLAAQSEARQFLQRVLNKGIKAKIISGTRTYKEQNRLYLQGRYGNPGPVVTRVRGGNSHHNFGIAWDIGIFTSSGGYLTNGLPYDQAAEAGLSPAIEWGGNWKGFVDKPHYQLNTGLNMASIKQRFELGEPLTMIA